MREKSRYFLPGLRWLLEKYLTYAFKIEAWKNKNKLPSLAQYIPEVLLLAILLSTAILYSLVIMYIISVFESINTNN